jgi:hypothetical protein
MPTVGASRSRGGGSNESRVPSSRHSENQPGCLDEKRRPCPVASPNLVGPCNGPCSHARGFLKSKATNRSDSPHSGMRFFLKRQISPRRGVLQEHRAAARKRKFFSRKPLIGWKTGSRGPAIASISARHGKWQKFRNGRHHDSRFN